MIIKKTECNLAALPQREPSLVVALGAALGLTTAQIDNAWKEAATI